VIKWTKLEMDAIAREATFVGVRNMMRWFKRWVIKWTKLEMDAIAREAVDQLTAQAEELQAQARQVELDHSVQVRKLEAEVSVLQAERDLLTQTLANYLALVKNTNAAPGLKGLHGIAPAGDGVGDEPSQRPVP
jgi:hypothetical protein